jgi:hypothetical protein
MYLFSEERDELVVEDVGRFPEVFALLPLLPTFVEAVEWNRTFDPLDKTGPNSERNNRIMSGSVFAAALLHQLVGNHEELHDALVQVEVLQALEEVGVLLAVASGLFREII